MKLITDEQYEAINELICSVKICEIEWNAIELPDNQMFRQCLKGEDWAIEQCDHSWEYTDRQKLCHPPLDVIKCKKCGIENTVQTT